MINTTLKTKVLLLGVASVALVGVFAVAALSLMRATATGYDHLLETDVAYMGEVEGAAIHYKKQVQEWKNVLLRGHEVADREKYWGRFQTHQDTLQSVVQTLLSKPLSSDVKRDLNAFLSEHQAIYPRYKEAYEIVVGSNWDYKAADSLVRGLDREPTVSLEKAAATLRRSAHNKVINLSESGMSVYSTSLVVVILAILASSVAAIIIGRRNISKPIEQLVESVTALSCGDFDFPVDCNSNDELGALANAVRGLQHKWAQSTSEISAAVERMGESDDKLESVSISIQAGTQQQSSRTDQMASAMTQMAATSREVAQHTVDASTASKMAENAANQGEGIMQHAIHTMGQMREHISSTTDVIRDLERKTTEVGTVLDVIGGIAEQTNLLALNAAIEAARAGEQGRGFAVVADEVRTLAQKTQESTEEINHIIESVQSGAQAAVKAVETGREQSEESMAKVNEAGEALNSIRTAVDEIAQVNQHIASAAQEQAHVSEEITKNVTEVAEVAEVVAEQANAVLSSTNTIREIRKNLQNTVTNIRTCG